MIVSLDVNCEHNPCDDKQSAYTMEPEPTMLEMPASFLYSGHLLEAVDLVSCLMLLAEHVIDVGVGMLPEAPRPVQSSAMDGPALPTQRPYVAPGCCDPLVFRILTWLQCESSGVEVGVISQASWGR